jgi:hypothetical protein
LLAEVAEAARALVVEVELVDFVQALLQQVVEEV